MPRSYEFGIGAGAEPLRLVASAPLNGLGSLRTVSADAKDFSLAVTRKMQAMANKLSVEVAVWLAHAKRLRPPKQSDPERVAGS